jgi:cyanophycinase
VSGGRPLARSIIDTHFSQRGRHGRLLTAAGRSRSAGIRHWLDEKTAIIVKGNKFQVIREGSVSVIDGKSIRHNDLVYMKKGECVGIFGATVHLLQNNYQFDLDKRERIAPAIAMKA